MIMTIRDMNIVRKEDMIELIDIIGSILVDIWLKKGIDEEDMNEHNEKLYKLKEKLMK